MPRRTFRGTGGEEILFTGKYGPGYRKYRNKKTEIDGIMFDSKGESFHYLKLKEDKANGKIKDFELQPIFKFPTDTRFKADFKVIHNDGRVVIQDYKSPITRRETAYRMRIKALKYFYPDVIFEEIGRR